MQAETRGAGVVGRPHCVPLSYLIHTKEVLLEYDHDISVLLSAFNISPKNLNDASFELPGQQYYALMEDLLKTIDIPALGVKVGRKFSVADYGVLGYAFISSHSLLQAMKIFFRYQAIVGSGAMFEEMLRIEGNKGIISVNCHSQSESIKRFEIEESFGQWLATADSV